MISDREIDNLLRLITVEPLGAPDYVERERQLRRAGAILLLPHLRGDLREYCESPSSRLRARVIESLLDGFAADEAVGARFGRSDAGHRRAVDASGTSEDSDG